MALSGSFYGTTANEYIKPKITWSATQDTAGNFSTITATLTYSRTNSGYTTEGDWTGSLSIGSDTANVSAKHLKITYNSNTVAITHTAKVYHANDGKLSVTICAAGGITNPSNSSLKNTNISANVTLDTIPRGSSISSVAAVILGNKCDVRWIPNDSSFQFNLKFTLGEWTETTAAIKPNKTSLHTYTGYTIPLEVAEQIKNDDEATMKVQLTTYSSGKVIGSDVKEFKVTVPQNTSTKPTVTMTLAPVNGLNGLYIQGHSKVAATKLSATGKYGASIKSYSLSVDGRSYGSPYQSDALTNVGAIEVTGYAVDSRGFTGEIKQTITVQEYSPPTLTGVEVYRCDSDGSPTDDGEQLLIKATRKYSPVTVDGIQQNFCDIKYSYTRDTWVSIEIPEQDHVLLAGSDGGSSVNAISKDSFDKTLTYTVYVQATDTVGQTYTYAVRIPTENILVHKLAGGKGMGMGGRCGGEDMLDVHWHINGRKSVNGMYIGQTAIDPTKRKATIRTVYSIDASAASSWQTFFVFGVCNTTPIYGVISVSEDFMTAQWTGQGNVTCSIGGNNYLVVDFHEDRNNPMMILSADMFNIIR